MGGQSKRQAAAIPFRWGLGGWEVLLVSLSSGGWGFPKGSVERGDGAAPTAQRETLEEAGVLGEILQPALGLFRYRKRGRPHQVQVYGLQAHTLVARWQEETQRTRIWVPIAEAAPLLKRSEFGPMVQRLEHRLLLEAVSRRLTRSTALRRVG